MGECSERGKKERKRWMLEVRRKIEIEKQQVKNKENCRLNWAYIVPKRQNFGIRTQLKPTNRNNFWKILIRISK